MILSEVQLLVMRCRGKGTLFRRSYVTTTKRQNDLRTDFNI